MYIYDKLDQTLVRERVAEFREQVKRRLAGELTEDQFRPLRLMNGLYLQLHAYMLRVSIPYGTLSSAQLKRLAHIARKYDRGYGHFTTRQNIQYHWIKLEQVPDILSDLADVQMHGIQTSGNCIRNISADHFAGSAGDEIEDPRISSEILRQWATFHPEFSFLPRKFKIAVTAAAHDRAAIQFHDIGLHIVRGPDGDIGYTVYAGGGMGRTPVVAPLIRQFLPKTELLSYVEAILRVYNRHGRRDNIYKARIKILVRDLGPEEFTRQVEEEWRQLRNEGVNLPAAEEQRIHRMFAQPPYETITEPVTSLNAQRKANPAFDRWIETNVHTHKVPGYAIVTISLKPVGQTPGDASADQMDAIANLAERFSFAEVRVSHIQNLILPNVKQTDLFTIWQELGKIGFADANAGLIGDIIACPGLDYCALANARSIPIAQEISKRFDNPQRAKEIGPLQIKISGCINACGHHHAGHIGILGVDRAGEELYQITLGGAADETAAIGQLMGPGFKSHEVVGAVEKIVDAYLELRQPGEEFLAAYRRLGPAPFKERVMSVINIAIGKPPSSVNDNWLRLADDASPNPADKVIVPFARLKAGDNQIFSAAAVGVEVAGADQIEDLKPWIDRLELVALRFTTFKDGRVFTSARLLRQRLNFKGDIRATGDFLPDQVGFMLRTGITSLEVSDTFSLEAAARSAHAYSVRYQHGADTQPIASEERARAQ